VAIETPVMMEVAEVATRHGKTPTRKAAAESAAHVSATESAAHTSATESTTNVSTATHVSTAKSAAHVTATATHVTAAATVSSPTAATSPAPRKRVCAQRACESGSCSQNDHGLT
jgi:hypothetical protein